MKVVRTPEAKTHKIVPVYPLENIEAPVITQNNNVVKVQPNNFLIDNKLITLSNSNSSSSLDLNKSNNSPKNNLINPNNHVINNEINTFQDISYLRKSDGLRLNNIISNSDPEKADSETNVDITSMKNIISENLRASRHHHEDSMVVPSQSGTRNILLDNAQNIASIVLTKTAKMKNDIVQQETTNTEASSENMLR